MRRRNQGIYLLFWIGAGLLLATVAANQMFASGVVDYHVLYGYLQRGWENTKEKQLGSVIRILLVRILQTAVVEVLCRGRMNRLSVGVLLSWAGCGAGFSMALMTWHRGAYGLIVFLLSNFPHQLFYGMAWGILIIRCLSGYEARRNRFRGAVLACLLFGILSEVHVNPMLLPLIS